MVPLPTGLHPGSGSGYEGISECELPAAEGPRFGSSCCRRQYFEGTEGETQKISTWPPEVPPPPPTIGGTGWGHTTIRETEGGVRRDGSEEAAVERLDLGGNVAANRQSSDAPPRRPPVPNGGGVGCTAKLEPLFAKIGGIAPHASARTSSPSLQVATSRRRSATSKGGIGQPPRRNPNRAITRWSVRLQTGSICTRGDNPQGTPSRSISLQLKSTTTYHRTARFGSSQGV
jgi:hypothetical protein